MGTKRCGPLDQAHPMAEIFVMFGFPRSFRAINREWEQLCSTRYLWLSSDTSNESDRSWLLPSFASRLVMSTHSRPTSSSKSPPEPPSCSSSSLSSSSSSSSSSNRVAPAGEVGNVASPSERVRGDDAGNASDRSVTLERPRPHVGPVWVDPKVCEVSSFFYTDTSVAEFLNDVPVLKASAEESLLAFGPCSLEDSVYRERSSTEPPLFFMYSCLFADLHVSLPFDAFIAEVLRELNMAPTQLHPNSWASMQAFRIVCQTFGVRPLPSCFLHFCASHPAEVVGWHSIVSRAGSVLFKAFTASYKNFKDKFFKVYVDYSIVCMLKRKMILIPRIVGVSHDFAKHSRKSYVFKFWSSIHHYF